MFQSIRTSARFKKSGFVPLASIRLHLSEPRLGPVTSSSLGHRKDSPVNCARRARPLVRTAHWLENHQLVRAVVRLVQETTTETEPRLGVYPGAAKLAIVTAGSTLFPNISTPVCSC